MSTLRIQLFGCIQVYDGNQPIPTINRRGQLILAYLLLYRHQAHRRETLAVLLWPDTNDAQARTNLRKELMRLRTALGGIDLNRYVRVTNTASYSGAMMHQLLSMSYALSSCLSLQIGVRGLVTKRVRSQPSSSRFKLYTADLMLNIYDEWVLWARQKLADQYAHALERIVVLLKIMKLARD